MRIRIRIGLVLAAALLALPVASRAEPKLDADQIALVEIGTTTRSEIEQRFGLPQSRKSGLESEIWIYQTSTGQAKRVAARMLGNFLNFLSPVRVPRVDARAGYRRLTITFDAGGVVANYEFEGI